MRDDFNDIDVFAFSEVNSEDAIEVYAAIAGHDEAGSYQDIYDSTGNSIRLALMFNNDRFDLGDIEELDFGLDSSGRVAYR